tara:strand:- start:86 stop:460 length:375 start_codon:yes stop_codon:yes gene_type:complete
MKPDIHTQAFLISSFCNSLFFNILFLVVVLILAYAFLSTSICFWLLLATLPFTKIALIFTASKTSKKRPKTASATAFLTALESIRLKLIYPHQKNVDSFSTIYKPYLLQHVTEYQTYFYSHEDK